MSQGDQDFADDLYFEHTKMSFWDHIEELRAHMWRAIMGFLVGLIVGLFVGKPMVGFIAAPVERALVEFHKERRKQIMKDLPTDERLRQLNEPRDFQLELDSEQMRTLAQALGAEKAAQDPQPLKLLAKVRPVEFFGQIAEAAEILNRPPTLSTLSATEAFIVYLKVSMYCGFVLASPWIFYQLWSFVAAGLYPHEKVLVHRTMPMSLALFLAGVALCEFVVLPVALGYLLSFNAWMNLEPDLRLSEWLTFAILFPLMFGIAFQLPLVMYALHRVGIVNVDVYRNNRRIAYFLIACSYIVIGMSPDAISMLSLIIPMFALYELGIFMCRFSPPPLLDLGAGEDEEEMVEA
jgi:sec-independent protein translocase protein TatC